MKRAFLLLAATALIPACSPAYEQVVTSSHEGELVVESAPNAPLELALADENLDWRISMPGAVTAIPELRDMILNPAMKARDEMIVAAKEDRAFREQDGFPFRPYTMTTNVGVAGESNRLVSLAISWDSYSGGAHPNHGTSGLVWDKKQSKAIEWRDLFANGDTAASVLHASYCPKLEAERLKRRGEVLKDGGIFTECPPLDDLAVMPADEDGDGLFEALIVHADPYVAGPWAEGDYDVVIPLPALPHPNFAASFAPQSQ